MSDILYKKLIGKFPPVGEFKVKRVTVYPQTDEENPRGIERIYVKFLEERFINKNSHLELGDLEKIANEVFPDIEFEGKSLGDEGDVILFNPGNPAKEYQKYQGHAFRFYYEGTVPIIEISTGNRGDIGLSDEQRERYFEFCMKVYDAHVKALERNPKNLDRD